ncbi:MAG: YdcF family protein [Gallintestinimicrobium sp.]
MSFWKRAASGIYLSDGKSGDACVLSGGQGSNEPVSEAQGMYDDLVKKGIDPKRLILEDQSTNTVENLRFSRKLIPREVQKVGIVTSNFHVYRACGWQNSRAF